MAQMVPDRLPKSASKGEERMFNVLKRLPDDCIVYFEPIIENRYPDFIVILPSLGLMVIEVKGWYPADVLSANSNEVVVKELGCEVHHDHPLRQARGYMYALMDRLRDLPSGQRLLQKEGRYKNRFAFPFGNFAVLSNITAKQLSSTKAGNAAEVFPPNKVVLRDRLVEWDEGGVEGDVLLDTLRGFFDPFWKIEPLREEQIAVLRAAIHPEVVISQAMAPQKEKPVADAVDLKVLDLRQENNARRIGDGHRIIFGVAGSGKTVLLIAKARLLAAQQPEANLLMLCYNVSLASFLKQALRDCPKVKVYHFDGWAKENEIVRTKTAPNQLEDDESLGARLLAKLESGQALHSCYFDLVMVDEAQDFELNWFSCVLAAMKDPNDGDLIIVGDGSQSLYGNRKVSWKSIGIQAQGRTISKNFDLDKNYRNSREIAELAAEFASLTADSEAEETIVAIGMDPSKCLRSTGFRPHFVREKSRESEVSCAFKIVRGLIDGNWFGNAIEPLQPYEIAIFYPYGGQQLKLLIEELEESIGELCPVVWINKNRESRRRVTDHAIKIQTIHSAKGLQYKAVVMLWADLLPKNLGNSTEEEDRKLFYVALTRPEDYLAITASESSKFVNEISSSGKVVIA